MSERLFDTLEPNIQEKLINEFLEANPLLRSFTITTIIKILNYGLDKGYQMAEQDQVTINNMRTVSDDEKQSLIKDK